MTELFCIGCLVQTDNMSMGLVYYIAPGQDLPMMPPLPPGSLVEHYRKTMLGEGGHYQDSNGRRIAAVADTIYEGTALCAAHARDALHYKHQVNPRPDTPRAPAWRPW
jgi:hypothetical protein